MTTPLRCSAVAIVLGVLTALPSAAQSTQPTLDLPAATVRLDGLPRIELETTERAASRRLLAPDAVQAQRLVIRVEQNRYFWGADRRPLTVQQSGEFIYLSSSSEPGKYIRVQKINDRLSYVAHLDQGRRSVTYWGEFRVVLGR